MQASSSRLGSHGSLPSNWSHLVKCMQEQREIPDRGRPTRSRRSTEPPAPSFRPSHASQVSPEESRGEVRGWMGGDACSMFALPRAVRSRLTRSHLSSRPRDRHIYAPATHRGHRDMRQDVLDFQIFRAQFLAAGSLYIIPESLIPPNDIARPTTTQSRQYKVIVWRGEPPGPRRQSLTDVE